MRIWRRAAGLFSSCVLAAYTLCACAKANGGFSFREDVRSEQTTLTFFGNINAASKMPALEHLITAYMALHPEVTIVYEGVDPSLSVDYNALLSKRLSTGNGDDLFFSYAGYLPTLVSGGYLEPLDGLDSWSAYADGEQDFLRSGGHYYGIPMERTVIGLYCNLELLERYQLDVPTTYDELLVCCSVLKSAGVTPIASSQLLPFSGYAYADGLSALYRSENAPVLISALSGGEDTYGPYFLRGFTHLEQLLEAGYIHRQDALDHDTTTHAEQLFAHGESAFLLGASDLNASIRSENKTLRYRVYPIPVSQGEGVVLSAPDHLLCVNADSPNREIALDFVAFCTQRANIEAYVARQGSLSPLTGSAVEGEELSPVAQIIAEGHALPSVDYGLTARLQNWIQQAGLSLLQGASPEETAELLDRLIPAPQSAEGDAP